MENQKNQEETMQPFSNMTECWWWKDQNCNLCEKYEDESEVIEDAGCPMAFSIDLASITDGEISLKMAKKIGLKNGQLVSKCKKFKEAKREVE